MSDTAQGSLLSFHFCSVSIVLFCFVSFRVGTDGGRGFLWDTGLRAPRAQEMAGSEKGTSVAQTQTLRAGYEILVLFKEVPWAWRKIH